MKIAWSKWVCGVYQTEWMHRHGIPPVSLWLVGWFVIPFEHFRLRRGKRQPGHHQS
jgi:hypothetical protein